MAKRDKKDKDNTNTQAPDKKEKTFRILDILIPVVCIGVMIFSGYNLYKIYMSYAEAEAIYDGIALFVKDSEDSPGDEAAKMEQAGFPYLNVDYDSLLDINEDYKGWLYFPLLDISYPVVYGDADFNYLHTAFDGTKSNSGCIFIDAWSDPGLRDMTTLFFGHNMRNGSMFGSLKRIRNEEGLILEDPYFYYYTPDTAYKIHVFAYYLENTNGLTYNCPTDNRTYDQYMDYILEKNEYESGPGTVDLSHRPKVITLSTCSGHNSGKRTVIHGVIEDTYKIGSDSGVIVDESFGDAAETVVQ